MNNDYFVSFIFLRDEIDFAHQLNFVFIIWLVWDSALNCFSLWFFLRSLSLSFNYSLSIDRRFVHCEITISHYFFSIYDYQSQCESYIFRRNLRFRKIRESFVFEWYFEEFRQNSRQNSKVLHIRCRRFVLKSKIDSLIAKTLTNEYATIRVFDISRFRRRFRIYRKRIVFSRF